MSHLIELGIEARKAAEFLAVASTEDKNRALEAVSHALLAHSADILAANAQDVDKARAGGMSDSMLDRLTLTQARIESIAAAIHTDR